MNKKPVKTNAVRILERSGADFDVVTYELPEGAEFSGALVRQALDADPEITYKTLCARGRSGGIAVFCIPAEAELDLKKAAAAAGEKSVELVHVKELRELTGYERGAVSPFGMKKAYPTFIEEAAQLWDRILVSGGAKGCSVSVAPSRIAEITGARFADLV